MTKKHLLQDPKVAAALTALEQAIKVALKARGERLNNLLVAAESLPTGPVSDPVARLSAGINGCGCQDCRADILDALSVEFGVTPRAAERVH